MNGMTQGNHFARRRSTSLATCAPGFGCDAPQRSPLWHVAVHEAGHAVLALHEGLLISDITVRSAPRKVGHVGYQSAPYAGDDALLRISLAGVVADRLRVSRWQPRSLDSAYCDISLVAEFLRPLSAKSQDFLITWNIDATHAILCRSWALVDAIATALVARGSLAASDVQRIIDAPRADRAPPGRLGRRQWQPLVHRIRFHIGRPGGILAGAPAHVLAHYTTPHRP